MSVRVLVCVSVFVLYESLGLSVDLRSQSEREMENEIKSLSRFKEQSEHTKLFD